jgi:alkylated DNA repair dioxygenase AlkB
MEIEKRENMKTRQHIPILPKDGEVLFFPDFFSLEESNFYLSQLSEEIAWKQEPIKICGKTVMQPRLTAWYGDYGKTYRYSGITMQPIRWTHTLREIKQRIEGVSPAVFNSALLNLYRDQQDSMGWHRDNEKELGLNPVIGSVSLGAPRVFQLRHHKDKNIRRSLELTHGSLLVMAGQTQHFWEHCVPKQSAPKGARINITFRKII